MPTNANKKVHPKEWASYMREYRKRRPDIIKSVDLKRNYGIDMQEFAKLLEKQNYVCAICEQSERTVIKGKVVSMAVDHCHETGEIRGLLCMSCNRAIGLLKHDPTLLEKAIQYLAT